VVHLLSSFLSQPKHVPLNMLPLVLELELDDADQCFLGTGNDWFINRPRLIGDVLTLDNALQNSYAKHILDGKTLPFMMHGLYSVRATIPPGSSLFSLPIARGFTRLSTAYITFYDDSGKWVSEYIAPSYDGIDAANTTEDDQVMWNITIGADRYPEFDVDSLGEAYHRLRLAQLMHQGTDSFSITPYQWRTNKHIAAMNFEKCPGKAGHTGVNTRSGSQLTFHFRGLAANINTVHVILHFEQAVNVSAAGVEVLD